MEDGRDPTSSPPRASAHSAFRLVAVEGRIAGDVAEVLHHGHDERDHQQTDDDVGENRAFSLVSSLVLYVFALLFSYLTGPRSALVLQRRDDAFNGGGERLTVLLVLEVDGDVLAEDGVADVVADT